MGYSTCHMHAALLGCPACPMPPVPSRHLHSHYASRLFQILEYPKLEGNPQGPSSPTHGSTQDHPKNQTLSECVIQMLLELWQAKCHDHFPREPKTEHSTPGEGTPLLCRARQSLPSPANTVIITPGNTTDSCSTCCQPRPPNLFQ